jgi:hypothetical protein
MWLSPPQSKIQNPKSRMAPAAGGSSRDIFLNADLAIRRIKTDMNFLFSCPFRVLRVVRGFSLKMPAKESTQEHKKPNHESHEAHERTRNKKKLSGFRSVLIRLIRQIRVQKNDSSLRTTHYYRHRI